jgi:hypothetical protein
MASAWRSGSFGIAFAAARYKAFKIECQNALEKSQPAGKVAYLDKLLDHPVTFPAGPFRFVGSFAQL